MNHGLARLVYRSVKSACMPFLSRHPRVHRFVRAQKEVLKGLISPLPDGERTVAPVQEKVFECEKRQDAPRGETRDLPGWLIEEWRTIHSIEPQLFPEGSIRLNIVTDFISESPVGEYYLDLCARYGEKARYVFLVPWLKKGGADLVTLNYVRALARRSLERGVVVITTENSDSPWAEKLPEGVRFIEFGKAYSSLTPDAQEKLLTRVLLQMAPEVVHTINSHLGYNVFIKYGRALKSVSRLYACVFCQDVTPEGRSIGYPICFLPGCFESLTAVMTENQYMVDRLCELFAFNRETFHVLYQPVDISPRRQFTDNVSAKGTLDVLWASRLDVQKRPDVLIKIAERCKDLPFTFHVYGTSVYGTTQHEVEYFTKSLTGLPNVNYYGAFDGLFSLATAGYDVFLYTAQWDGLPNVLLEAISLGLPVVASCVGGIPELIEHGRTGFLIDPYDDIDGYVRYLDKLYHDRTLIATVAESAYELITKRHTWERFSQELTKVPGYFNLPGAAELDTKLFERSSP